MQMTDLQPVADWLAFERDIHEKYGFNAHAYDEKGNLFTGETLWCNEICPAIRATKQGASAICSVANAAMAAAAKKTGKPVIDECDAGLLKITVPVIANGEMIGSVGGCGRILDDGEVDPFLVRMSTGIPEAEVEKLCGGLRPMTRAEAEEAAVDIERRVAQIVAAHAARRE